MAIFRKVELPMRTQPLSFLRNNRCYRGHVIASESAAISRKVELPIRTQSLSFHRNDRCFRGHVIASVSAAISRKEDLTMALLWSLYFLFKLQSTLHEEHQPLLMLQGWRLNHQEQPPLHLPLGQFDQVKYPDQI